MRTAIATIFVMTLLGQEQGPASADSERARAASQDAVVDFYDSMSDYFRQSNRAIMAINKKGIPDEEIPAVLLIARRSSASPNQILEARQSGKSWGDIAKENKVNLAGSDFVTEANLLFLSEYHGRPLEQVRSLHAKGRTFIAINRDLRRDGKGMPRATEKPKN